MKTIVLAHYYTSPQVQQLADFVGDSLELSIRAKEANADRIVFAGVRFMAETAKILNPQAEVILPNSESTCSLVTQVENHRRATPEYNRPALHDHITDLRQMTDIPFKVVTYINSSADLKALSDYIVTSANVEEIISDLIANSGRVLFTPDRNMGAYLKSIHPEWGEDFDYWQSAVCEVHDQFKLEEIKYAMNGWTDGRKYLIAHPESPLPVLQMSDMVGSTSKMLKWIKDFQGAVGTIFVATEDGLLYNMRQLRPELDIRQAPTYSGCQCNSCPYMKLNTEMAVLNAIVPDNGFGEIIELDEDLMDKARKPIERMLDYGL